jgi:MFS superfamily sulfate permease-like transporter
MTNGDGARRRDHRRRLAAFQGFVPIDRTRVPGDVLGGITLAALGIPEVMGYTRIAGTPVITGLYGPPASPRAKIHW